MAEHRPALPQRRRRFFELEPPPGYHWQGRAAVPGAPAREPSLVVPGLPEVLGREKWRQRFLRLMTWEAVTRLWPQVPAGTVLREYRYGKRSDTYFLEREWERDEA